MMKMPESPRWMALKGNFDNALETLNKLRGSDSVASKELQEIKESIASEASIKQFGCGDLMTPWVRRILFIGIGVAVAMRFTGVNTIMFYGTQILTEAGFGRQIAIIANGLTSVIATFFGIWLLGKIGRVTMFKAGILGTMGSLLIIALAAMNLEGSPSLPYIVLSMTIVFLWFN